MERNWCRNHRQAERNQKKKSVQKVESYRDTGHQCEILKEWQARQERIHCLSLTCKTLCAGQYGFYMSHFASNLSFPNPSLRIVGLLLDIFLWQCWHGAKFLRRNEIPLHKLFGICQRWPGEWLISVHTQQNTLQVSIRESVWCWSSLKFQFNLIP